VVGAVHPSIVVVTPVLGLSLVPLHPTSRIPNAAINESRNPKTCFIVGEASKQCAK
jgi:hypothetical protein